MRPREVPQASIPAARPHENAGMVPSLRLPATDRRSTAPSTNRVHVRGGQRTPATLKETDVVKVAQALHQVRVARARSSPADREMLGKPETIGRDWAAAQRLLVTNTVSTTRLLKYLEGRRRDALVGAHTTGQVAYALHEVREAAAQVDPGQREVQGRSDVTDLDWLVAQNLLRGYANRDALLATLSQRRHDANVRAAQTHELAGFHHQRRMLQSPGDAHLPQDKQELLARQDWDQASDVVTMGDEAFTGYRTRVQAEIAQLREAQDGNNN